jgi:hypothetical protein
MLSVDWEPDKGAWRHSGTEMDYGGILKGTPAFCCLLDELEVPCTWFVETSYDPSRDLPRCFPDVVRALSRRQQDELGLHIHWRRENDGQPAFYETADLDWVGAQLDHGVRQLAAMGARPLSFRSGALLHVDKLPRLLNERGFTVDSSTLWGKANQLRQDKQGAERKPFLSRLATMMHRAFAALPRPYSTADDDVERPGTSGVVEFPISYNVFDAKSPGRNAFCRYLKFKALAGKQTEYLMLFFHIDELTSPDTGPDEKTQPDVAMLSHFRAHLKGLKRSGAKFVTASEARKLWLVDWARESTPKLSL